MRFRRTALSLAAGLLSLVPCPSAPSAAPSRTATVDGTWNEVAPPARSDHEVVLDPVRRRMLVIHAAAEVDDPSNGVWAIPLDGPSVWCRFATAGTAPTDLASPGAAYDPVRDRILVFGGWNSTSDVWSLSLGGTPTWSLLATSGMPPSARHGHAFVYDPVRDRMIVFGGDTDYGNPQNDVWSLSLSGTPAWTQLAPSGPLPVPRSDLMSIYDPIRDRLLVFGGFDNSVGSGFHDVWALSLVPGSEGWSQLTPGGITLTGWYYAASSFYDPVRDRMVVFGSPSFLALNLSPSPSWAGVRTQAGPQGRPPDVYGRRAIGDPVGDRLIAYGGGLNGSDYNDTWQLNFSGTPTWSPLTPPAWPAGRSEHVAVFDGARARMIIQGGGASGSDYCCDPIDSPTWAYDLELETWTTLDASIPRPRPEMDNAAIVDPVRNRMILSGALTSSGSLSPTLYLSALDLSGGGWTHLTPTGVEPVWRNGHSAIYDDALDRMLIFGGFNYQAGGALNDVWALSLSSLTWQQLHPSGTLPPGSEDHIAIYDPGGNRMVVFGVTTQAQTWELSLGGSPAWHRIVTASDPTSPFIVRAAIRDPYRNRAVVIGTTYLPWRTDTWALNFSGPPAWRQLATSGIPPAHFENSRAIYDPVRDRMLVSFGELTPSSLWGLNFSDSPTPTLVSVVNAEALPGFARVTWQVSSGSAGFAVERCSVDEPWRTIGNVFVDVAGRVVFEDRGVRAGVRYGYRLTGAGVSGGETWLDIPLALQLSLRGAVPNPSPPVLSISFTLPTGAPAYLEVVDAAGRRVASREVGALGAGPHVLGFDRPPLAPGIYVVRLTQGARRLTARAVVLR